MPPAVENIITQLLLWYVRYENDPNLRLTLILGSVFLIFLLLAYIRHHYFRISIRGARSGFIFGILFTLLVEAIIVQVVAIKIIGTVPQNINLNALQQAAQSGVSQLQNVLGSFVQQSSSPSGQKK